MTILSVDCCGLTYSVREPAASKVHTCVTISLPTTVAVLTHNLNNLRDFSISLS